MALSACPICDVLIDSERGHWCRRLTVDDLRFLRALKIDPQQPPDIQQARQEDEDRFKPKS